MYTKAHNVEAVYYEAVLNMTSSEGCYALALDTAIELGGVEVQNSNDGEGSKSFAPSITFEFDDGSEAYVTYSGVYVIEPN